MRLRSVQDGSIPLALLVSIVVAGLITALVATVIQSERTVRFDRAYTTVVQAADTGVQEAYHLLSTGQIDLEVEESQQFSRESNGMSVDWEIERQTDRVFEVTSTGEASDGTLRTVVARIEKDALFFPGAFGDQLVGLQGQSTKVDSYESESTTCPPGEPETCWGDPWDTPPGTGRAALGTNEDFEFDGQVASVIRAVLYDWIDNPPDDGSITDDNPGGSRCKGTGQDHPCNHDVLRMVDDKLDFGSDAEMQFIHEKLDACTAEQWLHHDTWLDDDNDKGIRGLSRGQDVTRIGDSSPQAERARLAPWSTDPEDSEGSPADPDWENYWCADSLQVLGYVDLTAEASAETPVVVFVEDSYSQASQRHVAWPGGEADRNANFQQLAQQRSQRPVASALQLYIASDTPQGATANVSLANQSVFAGVIYAPRSVCESPQGGGAGADVYGALICRTIENVGNWRFHYDELLSDVTRETYSVATWREERPDGS